MAQNKSSAVMQQRHEALDSLDDFPTQPWATRALCERLLVDYYCTPAGCSVWEPAANRGHMVRPLAEYFKATFATDIHDYGSSYGLYDFTGGDLGARSVVVPQRVDWVITNPPFNAAEAFLHAAMRVATMGVAFFVRTSWLEGRDRYETIFASPELRPHAVYQFAERVCLLKGRLAAPWDLNPETGRPWSSATSYCWVVWCTDGRGDAETRLRWMPPCRDRLLRLSDYDTRPSRGKWTQAKP